MDLYGVIMAGGKGARFWPRSRQAKPKHLLEIMGGLSMIRDTADRIGRLVPPEKTLIVTSQSHAAEVIKHLPAIPSKNILVEPAGRNTAPCIGLAAVRIQGEDPDGIMIVLPSDHIIGDLQEFMRVLTVAVEAAQNGRYLVTIGIQPLGPETGYGYIEQGEREVTVHGEAVYRVRSFREKPAREAAQKFVENGKFLWNSGIFVWKASSILAAIEEFMPELFFGLREIARSFGTPYEEQVIREVYGRIQPASIDNGVLEKSSRVLLVNGRFGWNDVGSWDALWELMEKDEHGIAAKGHCISVNSRNTLVFASDRLVALVDVEDLIVVETADSILVCRKGSSQDVRKIVDVLEEKRMKDYL